jgi:hypothetical protein
VQIAAEPECVECACSGHLQSALPCR